MKTAIEENGNIAQTFGEEQGASHAKLIAAAPKLLEACKAVFAAASWTYDGPGGWIIPAGSDGCMMQLKNAIEAAEGK